MNTYRILIDGIIYTVKADTATVTESGALLFEVIVGETLSGYLRYETVAGYASWVSFEKVTEVK